MLVPIIFMELVVLLSTGKGTWGQVSGLMQKGEWEKVIVVGTSFAKDLAIAITPALAAA